MKSVNQKACWKIMQCKTPEKCAVQKQKDTACWETAQEQDDYQFALNICKDCIVYLLKQDNTAFTKQQMSQILQERKSHYNFG